MIATMIIFAAAIMPSITFQIKRDREEEMIHRGVQYSRAIRLYYRKFGRYPTKLEDLESTNNMRFLRKRYKDPVAGQDFKLLHFGEAQLSMAGGGIPGVNPMDNLGVSNANGAQSAPFGNGGFASTSSFGGTNSFGLNSALGQSRQVTAQPTSSDSSEPSSPDAQSNDPGSSSSGTNSGGQLSGQVIGGPIVGVVSSSKAVGIREFDHKRKYNEWQFVFDPMIGMGLPTAPNQHPLQFSPQPLTPNNSAGIPGRSSSGGLQNDSNLPATGGIASTNQSGDPATQPTNPQ